MGNTVLELTIAKFRKEGKKENQNLFLKASAATPASVTAITPNPGVSGTTLSVVSPLAFKPLASTVSFTLYVKGSMLSGIGTATWFVTGGLVSGLTGGRLNSFLKPAAEITTWKFKSPLHSAGFQSTVTV